MESGCLRVRTLGQFTLEWAGKRITDGENRSKKVWLLLACLIDSRGRAVTAEELTKILWEEEPCRSTNPLNALKAILHRARAALDLLGADMGRRLILRQREGYLWNPEVPLEADTEEFLRLCREGELAGQPEERLECWTAALTCYRGVYLPKLSDSPWAARRAAALHRRYLEILRRAFPLLGEAGRWAELVRLGRTALKLEPQDEDLSCQVMEALLRLEDPQGAAAVYEGLRDGQNGRPDALPAEKLRELYQEALRRLDPQALPLEVIQERLQEPEGPGGALLCSYDLFRAIYHSTARLLRRSGGTVHLAVLSLTGTGAKPLSKRSLDRAAANLMEVLRVNLRRGDSAAQCTASQFVVLLPQADYGNSHKVCARIRRAFEQAYPHSPAQLHAAVQPLS